MYLGVELRLQRYAVILAEELNFTRAAEKLNVAQPALSRSIRQLEHFLGFDLFIRSSRQVEVTAAGRAFVEHARLALRHAERAIQAARSVHKEEAATVKLGRSPFVNPQLVSTLLTLSHSSHPSMKLELSSAFTVELISRLQTGSLRLALVVLPIVQRDIACHVISRANFMIGMPHSHRLARKKQLELKDLDEEAILSFARHLNPVFVEWMESKFEEAGANPTLLEQVMTSDEAFHLAVEGRGLCMTPEHEAKRKADFDLTFRPLQGILFETALAWQSEETSEVILDFVNTVLREFSKIGQSKQLKLSA